MIFRVANGQDDAEIVRQLRNAGLEWFHDKHEITADEQVMWWRDAVALGPKNFICMLFGEPPLGYGMLLRRSDGRLWVSLAVAKEARGRGIGTFIYKALAIRARPIYAAIRRDNKASLRAVARARYVRDDAVPTPDGEENYIVFRGP